MKVWAATVVAAVVAVVAVFAELVHQRRQLIVMAYRSELQRSRAYQTLIGSESFI